MATLISKTFNQTTGLKNTVGFLVNTNIFKGKKIALKTFKIKSRNLPMLEYNPTWTVGILTVGTGVLTEQTLSFVNQNLGDGADFVYSINQFVSMVNVALATCATALAIAPPLFCFNEELQVFQMNYTESVYGTTYKIGFNSSLMSLFGNSFPCTILTATPFTTSTLVNDYFNRLDYSDNLYNASNVNLEPTIQPVYVSSSTTAIATSLYRNIKQAFPTPDTFQQIDSIRLRLQNTNIAPSMQIDVLNDVNTDNSTFSQIISASIPSNDKFHSGAYVCELSSPIVLDIPQGNLSSPAFTIMCDCLINGTVRPILFGVGSSVVLHLESTI